MSDDLQIIKDVIMETGEFTSVILFGSRADGQHRPGSDYDLLLIAPDAGDRSWKMERTRTLRKKLAAMGYDVDLHIKTPEEVEKRRDTVNTLAYAALKYGVPL